MRAVQHKKDPIQQAEEGIIDQTKRRIDPMHDEEDESSAG
jgi:hypothetical protein